MKMKRPKILGISAVAGLVALTGCESIVYSTDVSVGRRASGVSDYTVVPSLPNGDLPASMPVVVEAKSRGTESLDDPVWSVLLCCGTLGVFPAITCSEATVYDMTVRTSLGEKSGTCAVKAYKCTGWLALFMPYLGLADELAFDNFPKMPNETLETKVRDRLVANLVSQFPKEEYDRHVAKWNSSEGKAKRAQAAEAERIRWAKEAEERRLALHGNLVAEAVTNDLAKIRKRYEDGDRYLNPFPGTKEDWGSDWLARWASPRLALTEADALAGEAILSEFGTKYLPNAYANYEKRREALAEIQQVFNEEFPQPWTIKETNPKWNSFNKVLERFAKARTETFLCHDELCHYWLLWRLGVLPAGDLAAVDAKRLSVPLLPENVKCTKLGLLSLKPLEGKIADFAAKYAPASSGAYQKMSREFKELAALLAEVGRQRRQMDDVRYSRALAAAVDKRNALARELNALSLQLQTWYMDYRTAEKSADNVARCDTDMARKLKPFLDSLPGYVKERTLGPVIRASDLVAIPGKSYRMQRTEVTQLQWMVVMGNNPSRFQGLDRPVENVSWDDCQAFIKRASAMDGRPYRLPTEEEWEYACRAGSTGDWGRRANGECGPVEVMGWCESEGGWNSGTHPVAQKEPNAWGLYDMHGNVAEWCQNELEPDSSRRFRKGRHKVDDSYGVIRGGAWNTGRYWCSASWRDNDCLKRDREDNRGFRLVAPLE